MPKIDQRLNGLNPLSYLGFDAAQPSEIIIRNRDPLTSDYRNVYLGNWWLNTATNDLFYLASLRNSMASWINISSGGSGILTLTANAGGPVSPTAGNINIVGDGTTIQVVGNPGAYSLVVSAINSSNISSLTGNTGGPVFPTAGNINLVGSGPISVAGNPGLSTLTISQSGAVANSFPTDAGTAVPAAGILNVIGSNGLSTTGSSNTVTVVGGGSLARSFITSPATGTAVPAAGVLTFAAGAATTITAAGSTISVGGSGSGVVPSYSTGTFVPALSVAGNRTGFTYSKQLGVYTQVGSLVYVQMDIALTAIPAGVGNIFVEDLPFTVKNGLSTHQDSMKLNMITTANVASGLFLYIRFAPATTTGQFLYGYMQTTAGGNIITTNLKSTTAFTVCGCYFK